MPYTGHRPILPGQNSTDWAHNVTGEVGEYSNYQLQSSTHLLEDMPLEDHTPGTGRHPHGLLLSQMYTGDHQYLPMEVPRYIGYGQNAPYLRFAQFEFHGVSGASAFPRDFGHDGKRVFTFSHYFNHGQDKVPSAVELDGGHTLRAYGSGAANMGRVKHYEHNGAGDSAINDPGQDYEQGRYGFEKVNEHNGVPSSSALSV